MTYICLTGLVPFKGESIEELNTNILNKDIDFENKLGISQKMKFILSKMLVKNPRE